MATMQQRNRHNANGREGRLPLHRSSGGTIDAGSAPSTNSSVERTKKRRGELRFPGICLPIVTAALVLWGLTLASHMSRFIKARDSDDRHHQPAPVEGGFEFRGHTRTEGRYPRIAIVTNAVAFPYDKKTTAQWSMFKEYFANKDCYARAHGYDLIVDSR